MIDQLRFFLLSVMLFVLCIRLVSENNDFGLDISRKNNITIYNDL